jgi:hypothetical protein
MYDILDNVALGFGMAWWFWVRMSLTENVDKCTDGVAHSRYSLLRKGMEKIHFRDQLGLDTIHHPSLLFEMNCPTLQSNPFR